jgi:hypothetical protein
MTPSANWSPSGHGGSLPSPAGLPIAPAERLAHTQTHQPITIGPGDLEDRHDRHDRN